MIYNSDTGRPEDYRMYPPGVSGPVANNGNTEPGCSSIAQSFKPNTSTSITDIVTKVSFGGNVGYVTLNIYEGEGIAGALLYTDTTEFSNLTVENGNEYKFELSSPLAISCCAIKTFEIKQAGNSQMSAYINFVNMVSYDATSESSPDAYPDGKFYKNGVNNDSIDGSGAPTVVVTSRDLDFVVNVRFIGWVTQ